MAEEGRSYVAREARMVIEWIQEEHPNSLQWRRVRIGPVPSGAAANLVGVIRRWADAVFFENDMIYIVEAKIGPDVGAIAQLELYRDLFPKTPEFFQWKDKPIKLIFLTSLMDKAAKQLAESKGIEYILYSPAWVKEYWKEKIERSS